MFLRRPLPDEQNLLEAPIHVTHTLRKRHLSKTAGPGTSVSCSPITSHKTYGAGREAHGAWPSPVGASGGPAPEAKDARTEPPAISAPAGPPSGPQTPHAQLGAGSRCSSFWCQRGTTPQGVSHCPAPHSIVLTHPLQPEGVLRGHQCVPTKGGQWQGDEGSRERAASRGLQGGRDIFREGDSAPLGPACLHVLV